MISSLNPIVIVALVLVLVVLFNLGLFAKIKQNTKTNNNSAMNSMLNTARSPWKAEDADLDELSALVKMVQGESEGENEKI